MRFFSVWVLIFWCICLDKDPIFKDDCELKKEYENLHKKYFTEIKCMWELQHFYVQIL